MADMPTPVPDPIPTPTPDIGLGDLVEVPPVPLPPLPAIMGDRRLRIICVPLWWLAKPKPPRHAALTFEAYLLVALFPDFPPDLAFTGSSNVNIYTQTKDFVVTHPSFEEQDEGTNVPTFYPTWLNIRAAILYS